MLNLYSVKVVCEHGVFNDDFVVARSAKDACKDAKLDYLRDVELEFGEGVQADRIMGCVVQMVSADI